MAASHPLDLKCMCAHCHGCQELHWPGLLMQNCKDSCRITVIGVCFAQMHVCKVALEEHSRLKRKRADLD